MSIATQDLSTLQRGHFAAIAADPPWNFQTRSPKGAGRSPSQHYATMDLPAIKALPVADIAAPDSFLFLWSTWPHLPQALQVMSSWGFEYSGSAFVWAKQRRAFDANQIRIIPTNDSDFFLGCGYGTRKNTEPVLLGRRGKPKRLSASVRELIVAPVREHSRKPDQFYTNVEEFCAGPRLELFARERRPGWCAFGDEIDRFAMSA